MSLGQREGYGERRMAVGGARWGERRMAVGCVRCRERSRAGCVGEKASEKKLILQNNKDQMRDSPKLRFQLKAVFFAEVTKPPQYNLKI